MSKAGKISESGCSQMIVRRAQDMVSSDLDFLIGDAMRDFEHFMGSQMFKECNRVLCLGPAACYDYMPYDQKAVIWIKLFKGKYTLGIAVIASGSVDSASKLFEQYSIYRNVSINDSKNSTVKEIPLD